MHKFQLGNKIKDLVSGVEGITTGRIEFLNGCVQYNITPTAGKDGKTAETFYYDQNQLVLVDKGIAEQVTQSPAGSPNTGGAPTRIRQRL